MEAILSLMSINCCLGIFLFSSPCCFLFISSHCLTSICLWCWRVSSTVWWPLINSLGVNPNMPAGSLWVWGCMQGGCGPAGFLWGDWQVGCRQTGHAAVARGHRVIPEMFLIPCPWVGEGPSPGGLLSQLGRGVGIPQFTELIFTEFLCFQLWVLLPPPRWVFLSHYILRLNLQSGRQRTLLVRVVVGVGKGTW